MPPNRKVILSANEVKPMRVSRILVVSDGGRSEKLGENIQHIIHLVPFILKEKKAELMFSALIHYHVV